MVSLIANVTLPPTRDLMAVGPELLAAATVMLVLLLPMFLPKRSRVVPAITAIGGLASAAMAAAMSGNAGLLGPAFDGLLVVDGLSCFLRMLVYAALALTALMWLIVAARRPDDDSVAHPPEFFVLLISAAVGMALMVSTRNLLMAVVAIELASLPSYMMAGFQKRRRLGAEAALKYVVFGAATAAIMIYGISLLYGCFGTFDAGVMARQIAADGVPLAAAVGLLGLLAGIGFKISAVPFHFWCPDVFEGASMEVAAFLSVASKAAGLTLLARLAMTLGQFDPNLAVPTTAWAIALALGIVASITATVGNLAAMHQSNIKRMLAYSSIAHAGYMLMGACILSDSTGVSAILLYLVVYLFMNLGAFSVAALVANQTGSEEISAFAGLGRRSPVLAISMAVLMVSLVGLPPLAGFAAKYQLFAALFFYKPYPLGWLVAVGLVNTLISLVFYMRVIRAMFLEESDLPPVAASGLSLGWAVMLTVPSALLLVLWQPLTVAAEYFGALVHLVP